MTTHGKCERFAPAAIARLTFLAGLTLVASTLSLSTACNRSTENNTATSQPVTNAERTAETGPVALRVTIDRTDVAVPDQIKMTIAIEAEIGVEVTMPELGETLGSFGVAGFVDDEPQEDDFKETRSRVYTLDTILSGELEVPPISVSFADPREKADGSHAMYEDTVSTGPIPVTVRAGLADIKGPMTLPLARRYRLLLWTLGVLAAIVAIALGARWWRRRGKEQAVKLQMARRIIPHQWALAELEKLAAEDLIGKGRIQEFYYRINALLRRYIELRFGLMAGEQTSEEFIRTLQFSAMFDAHHKEVLQRFVSACDPVKYARHRPESDEIDWVQATAREFVIETAQRDAQPGRAPVAVPVQQGEPL